MRKIIFTGQAFAEMELQVKTCTNGLAWKKRDFAKYKGSKMITF